jgi:hypothetical protein
MAAGTVTDRRMTTRFALPRLARIPMARIPMALGGALLCAGPAVAQFDAPRPPGSVPVRPQPQYQQPQYQPPQYQPQPQWQQAAPQPAVTPAVRQGANPGGIQSEDLPAPGGAGVQPAALPQGSRQQRPGSPPPAAAAAAPPPPASPPADVVTAPPAQRITNPTAVFNGLDKITGRITSFESAIGETVQFGALQVTARACYSRPPTETPLTDGFVEVDEVTLQGEVRRIFTGWMFAASPGLHGVEHAVYDVWLVDCKGGAQVAADPQPATSAAAPPRQSTQQRQGQGTSQQRQRQPAAAPPPPGVR